MVAMRSRPICMNLPRRPGSMEEAPDITAPSSRYPMSLASLSPEGPDLVNRSAVGVPGRAATATPMLSTVGLGATVIATDLVSLSRVSTKPAYMSKTAFIFAPGIGLAWDMLVFAPACLILSPTPGPTSLATAGMLAWIHSGDCMALVVSAASRTPASDLAGPALSVPARAANVSALADGAIKTNPPRLVAYMDAPSSELMPLGSGLLSLGLPATNWLKSETGTRIARPCVRASGHLASADADPNTTNTPSALTPASMELPRIPPNCILIIIPTGLGETPVMYWSR